MIHFKKSEFKCNCGKCWLTFENMDEEFIYWLDKARAFAEVPFIITSSIRCIEHNRTVGGSKTSSYLKGLAVDIKCTSSYERYRIIEGLRIAGFNRIGIGKDFIHADKDTDKPKELIWIY